MIIKEPEQAEVEESKIKMVEPEGNHNHQMKDKGYKKK